MTDEKEDARPRTVLLASPSYDGKVSVWHAAALSETCKIGMANGINVLALYLSFDALVQRARNDIFKIAYDNKVDDLVFIDTDQDWNPQDFFKLLSHDVEIVGAPVVKKSDQPSYNIKLIGDYEVLENGLVSVDSVGTGMLRIRSDAIKKIWESSEEYREDYKPEPTRMVFNVKVIDGQLWSEDVIFCENWTSSGGKIYIDPTINCGHSGEKRWVGNFEEWIKLALEARASKNGRKEK